MLGVQIKGDFILHPTFFPGQTCLLGTLAGGRDVLAQPHPPTTTAKVSAVQPSRVGTAALGPCCPADTGVPLPPFLPHTLACQGLPGIASHLCSLHAVEHRGAISHGTVTSHVNGVFCKATAVCLSFLL